MGTCLGATPRGNNRCALSYVELEHGVGMVVAPLPIGLLIPLLKPVKVVVFAMTLLDPHAIGLILMLIPFMIVVMFGVVVTAIVAPFIVAPFVLPVVVLGPESRGRKCNRNHQGGAQ